MSRQHDFLKRRQQSPQPQGRFTASPTVAAAVSPRVARRRVRRPSRLHMETRMKLEAIFSYPFWENGMLLILLSAVVYTSLCFFIYVI